MPTPGSLDPAHVAAVFKAYDVRGLVPEQIDAELVRRTGAGLVAVTGADRVVVGNDMRPSSPDLVRAFSDGVTRVGADVVRIGLCSTDGLYFASGLLGLPGAMFTASHNPAQYNGIKMCRAEAVPIGLDTGLAAIRDHVIADDVPDAARPGTVTEQDLLSAYAEHLLELAPVAGRSLSVVADAGNGMAGLTAPAVLGRLDIDLHPLYFELDGTFPHHEANPIDPANLVDLQAEVRRLGADIGLAFDGDADRCFVVDERGELVDPSTLTALIAARELTRSPGSVVIHNLITSSSVPQIVREHGGSPVRTRVGHSFIKATMAQTDAVFGGEHSGHFYFRDFWRADSGMLAALHVLSALAETDAPLSALLAPYARYVMSGEINSTVADAAAATERVRADWADEALEVDHLDGMTIRYDGGWFNVRASNTEPLLRLNVEGRDDDTMTAVRDRVLATIRSEA